MRKVFLLIAFIASVASISAKVKIGDLYYNLDAENKTAEVTYQELWSTSDNYPDLTTADIPTFVEYDGDVYTIVRIGENAFQYSTNLTTVTIPNSVTTIYPYAFQSTGITAVVIPTSVDSIHHFAFSTCTNLVSVNIPNSVKYVGNGAFNGCTSMPVIDNLRYADTYLVEAADKTLTSYTIKEGTKWIGKNAFRECSNLISLALPNTVIDIQEYAFRACTNLTSIEIPNSVTYIASAAFRDCAALTSIELPNSVIQIGGEAFRGCTGLTSVTCFATILPECRSDAFKEVDCSKIPLYVHANSIDAYAVAEPWKEFKPILPIPSTEDIDIVNSSIKHDTNKLLHNGQIFILRGNKTYTLTGQEVK